MRKKTVKTEVEKKQIQWGESYKSLLLGLIVVLIAVVIFFSFGKNRHIKQTSSTRDGPVNQQEKARNLNKNTKAQKTYVVKPGDDLWNIAVKEYGDGYKWVDIAKANNLESPDLIFSENVLKIPR